MPAPTEDAAATDSRPRVLHVMGTAEVGGGAEHLVQLVEGLLARGFSCRAAFGVDGPTTGRLRELGVPVTVLRPLRFTGAGRLARLFRATPADLIHLHGSRAGYLGATAARRVDAAPVIYTAHAFSFRRRLPGVLRALAVRAERVTCDAARRVICLSQDDLDLAVRLGIPMDHAVVVPNGIVVERFAGAASRRDEFGYAPGTPVVGMITRLVEGKDPLAFVEVARRIAAASPAARFLVVGDGPLRGRFEGAIGHAGLAPRVRLTGFRTDVPALLATIDVLVSTSLWESQGLSVLEAMAAGRAIVATDISGHRSMLDGTDVGWLVPPGDDAAMAEAVVRLIGDPALRARMGALAQERVRTRYGLEPMLEATAAVYRDALAATSPRQPA